jgi:hypothetical protein
MIQSVAVKAALLAALALSATAPGPALASRFDPRRIPADADGVGHLDLEALRRTALHRHMAPGLQKGQHWNDIDAAHRPLLRTLIDTARGVSFWATDRDTGAILIQVADARRIQALLERLPHKGQLRVAGHVARKLDFSSAADGAPADEPTLAALVGDLLILSDDEVSLARAIQAATAQTRTLATAGKTPPVARERGPFFFAALRGGFLDHIKDTAQSATLSANMSSLTFQLSERRSEVRCRARLVLGSAKEAQQLKSMAEGLVALMSISDDADAAQARALARGLTITATGKTLDASLVVPAADLARWIESNQ